MRKRFLGYEFPHPVDGAKWGLSRKGRPYFFATGTLIHETLQDLLMGKEIEDAIAISRSKAKDSFDDNVHFEEGAPILLARTEQLDLVEALARAFARFRLPSLLEDFHVEGVEVPINVPLSPSLTAMFRLDAVLRRKADDAFFAWELKSTASASPYWMKQWELNIQLMAETIALAHLKGPGLEHKVRGIILEGVVKGGRRKDKDGVVRQNSPLIYCYYKPGNGFDDAKWSHSWLRGGTKQLVSQTPFPDVAVEDRLWWWLMQLPDSVVMEQLVALPVIARATLREQSWLRQTVAMENRIAKIKFSPFDGTDEWWASLDEEWPQNTSNCEYCEFLKVCHEPAGRGSLLNEFEPRTANHALEKESRSETRGRN